MSLKHLLWWALGGLVAFFIGHATHNTLWVPTYLAGSAIVYVLDCRRNPSHDCWRCGGKGEARSLIWRYAHGPCSRCGRTGRQRRLGSRIFRFYE